MVKKTILHDMKHTTLPLLIKYLLLSLNGLIRLLLLELLSFLHDWMHADCAVSLELTPGAASLIYPTCQPGV